MRQLLYVSNTARDTPAAELAAILEVSRRNNALLGLTGMLLYIEGGFLQVLEGDERAVRETYDRIRRDQRHWDTRILLDRAEERAFAGWSMGFEHVRVDDPQTAGIFGVTREAVASRLAPGAGRVVMTLVETFYRVQQGGDLKLARMG